MKTFGVSRALRLIRRAAKSGVGLYCSISTAVVCVSSLAHGAPPQPLTLAAHGTCPSAENVATQLRNIMPALEVTAATLLAYSDVQLDESDAGFSVTVAGAHRDFKDPERQCDERAKQAAVFIALMLDPLHLPPRPVVPAPAAAPVPAPTPLHTARASWDLEAAPVLAVSPWSTLATTPISGGASLRLSCGKLLSLTAGASVLSTATLEYPAARARESLIPLDAGGRLTWVNAGWDFAFELGASVAPAYLRGQRLDVTEAGWRVELGARSALLAHWWLTRRLGLVAAESGLFWPRPISLKVGGVGEVGHTPRFWLGSQLGLVLRLN